MARLRAERCTTLAFDDEFVRRGGEPVHGCLSEQWVGHDSQPFVGRSVGGQHRRGLLVSRDDEFVESAVAVAFHGLEGKIIDYQ